MADSKFSGAGINKSRRYSVKISSPLLLDTPYLPDFVLNGIYSLKLDTSTAQIYPITKYNDPNFKVKGANLTLLNARNQKIIKLV